MLYADPALVYGDRGVAGDKFFFIIPDVIHRVIRKCHTRVIHDIGSLLGDLTAGNVIHIYHTEKHLF